MQAEIKDTEPIRDDLYYYMKQISATPLLSPEREAELGRIVQSGQDDGQAKEELIKSNLRYVVKMARQYHRSSGRPLMDLIQEGNIGLMTAAEKFDPDKGFRFLTYATWWIYQAMQRSVMEKGHTIYLPIQLQGQLSRVTRAAKKLFTELNREPTITEISKSVKMSVAKVNKLLECQQLNTMYSLNFELDGAEYGDYVTDEEQDSHEEIERRQVSEKVLEYINQKLPAREADILFRRADGQTLDDIGREYGICRERVRQLESKAIRRLRCPCHKALRELACG